MLERLRNVFKQEKGFTLIELLVVIAIIGILAAIAIPQFAAYKKQGNDSAAKSDLRNFAVAMEAYYVQNNAYAAAVATVTAGDYGFKVVSRNVTLTDPAAGGGCAAVALLSACWYATSTHSGGSTDPATGVVKIFLWDTTAGGCLNC